MKKFKSSGYTYEITAITKGGETLPADKVNTKKRHSKNNTIIGWNLYQNGIYKKTMYK